MIHKTKVVSLHWSAVFSPDAVQLHGNGNRFTVSTRSGGFMGLSLFFSSRGTRSSRSPRLAHS